MASNVLKIGTPISQTNQFQAGELSIVEQMNPNGQNYPLGCEYLNGFDIVPGAGIKPGLSNSTDAISISYRGNEFAQHLKDQTSIKRYYIKNTDSINDVALSSEVDSIPDETEVMSYDSLSALIAYGISDKKYLAKYTSSAASDYTLWKSCGKWDQYSSVSPIIRAGSYFQVETYFTYFSGYWGWYRTSSMVDNLAVGKEKYEPYSTETGWSIQHKRKSTGYADKYTMGRGWHKVAYASGQSNAYYSPVYYTIAPGIYLANSDIYLVGYGGMFYSPGVLSATDDDIYAPTNIMFPEDDSSDNRKDVFSQTYLSTPVLAFGSFDQTTSQTPNFVLDGYGSGKGLTNSAATFYSVYESGAGCQFYFTGFTFVHGDRRFGPAKFYGGSADSADNTPKLGFGASRLYFGGGNTEFIDYNAISGSDYAETNGRGLQLIAGATYLDATSSDAYFVQLDGPCVWCERTPRGFVIGTPYTEYLLTNDQSKTNVTLQKVSSIGSWLESTPDVSNLFQQSCQLDGNIYFVSRYGITTMQYSNDTQSYLPKHFKKEFRRFSKQNINSITSSITEKCVYFSTDGGEIWKLWPDTGGASSVDLNVLIDESTQIKPTGVFNRDDDTYMIGITEPLTESFSTWPSLGYSSGDYVDFYKFKIGIFSSWDIANYSSGSNPYFCVHNTKNNYIYSCSYNLGTISILEASSGKSIGSITVGLGVCKVVYDSADNYIYCLSTGVNTIYCIDCSTNKVISSLLIGTVATVTLYDIIYNKNTNSIYLTAITIGINSPYIDIIDASKNTLRSTVTYSVSEIETLTYMAIDDTNNIIYASAHSGNSTSSGHSIVQLDCNNNTITFLLSVLHQPSYLCFQIIGTGVRRLFVETLYLEIYVIDVTSSGATQSAVLSNANFDGPIITVEGILYVCGYGTKRISVGSYFPYSNTYIEHYSIKVGGKPYSICYNSVNNNFFVSNYEEGFSQKLTKNSTTTLINSIYKSTSDSNKYFPISAGNWNSSCGSISLYSGAWCYDSTNAIYVLCINYDGSYHDYSGTLISGTFISSSNSPSSWDEYIEKKSMYLLGQGKAERSTVRTTKFGFTPDGECKIIKIFITMYQCFGGRYKLSSEDTLGQDGNEDYSLWHEFVYPQKNNGANYSNDSPFTGVLSIDGIFDEKGFENMGKSISVTFNENERCGAITSITAKGEI